MANTAKLIGLLEAIKKDWNKNSLATFQVLEVELENLRFELARQNAKKAGKTDLLKACKSVLKSANKTYNRALHGITTINDTSYVCDSYRLISFPAGSVDLPPISEDVKPMEYEKIMKHAEFTIKKPLPEAAFLASEIKRIKAAEKAVGRKPAIYIYSFGGMYVNAEYLLDAIIATGADHMEASNEKSPVFLEKDNVVALVLPIHPGTVPDIEEGKVVPRY